MNRAGTPCSASNTTGMPASATANSEYRFPTRRNIIPRRVTLYSAVFGVGHEESSDESDYDDDDNDSDDVMDASNDEIVGGSGSTPGEPESIPLSASPARPTLEVLALESPQPPTHHLFQPPRIPSPILSTNHSPMQSPGQLPHHSPILSPEPEQPIAPKRRIAPTLVTTELPATSSCLGQPLVLIPPPTLAPHEAREQLRSAFAQSQSRPFQTFTRRCLVARPAGDPHIDPPPPVLVSAKSADEMVPRFLAAANNVFWFCRHASFKQDHIIAQLQALEGSSQEQEQRRSALDADIVAMQSWMWRHMRANSELLHGDFDDEDDEVLPLYGESDDEDSEGEYSDSFLREIHADQLETSKRRVRLETVEQERVSEVRRIMKQQLALFASEWLAKKQPRLELRASYLWRRHVAGRSHLEQRLARLEGERLPKAQNAVIDSGVSRKADMIKLCENLRPTTDIIAEIAWLLDLTAGPQPLPLRQRQLSLRQAPDRGPRTRKSNPPRKCMAQRYHGSSYSATLPGLSSRSNRPSRPNNADAISDIDDDSSSVDSMDDFIDDDDSGMAPMAGADLATGRFASMSLGSPTSAPTGEHLIAQQPSLAADAFAAELRQHSADVMYSSATDYIRQMAQGIASLSSTGASGEPVSASIALRVWAEFQHWIHTVRPAVRVQYASQPECDKAKRQMDHLLRLQRAGADVEISIKPPQRWVPKQYAEVANAVVATPLLHMRAKDRSPSRLPTDKTGESSRSSTSLVIEGRHLPEVVHVLHDQGVAQRAAFSEFYRWRQHSNGTRRMPAIALSDEGSDSTNNTGEDVRQSRRSLPPLPPPQLDDAMDVSDSTDGQKPQLLRKRTRGDLTSSSDDDSTHGGEAEVAEQLALSSPVSQQQQQQQQPKEPDMPKTPARGGRRNIRPIREESASVLEMRRVQQQASQEISRRSREAAAAAASRSGHAPAAQQQAPVIVTIEDDDDDEVGEVVMSGTMPAIAATMELSTVSIDIGQIGSPVLINPGHLDDQSEVMIPGFIAGHLKPHQVDGVRFMWRSLVMLSNHHRNSGGSGRINSGGQQILSQHGCVLAHSMGLGKTLQTIALIYTLLNEVSAPTPTPEFTNSNFATRRVLILCPATVQANWTDEFWKWTGVQHTMLASNARHKALDGPILPPSFYSGGQSMNPRSKLLTLQALRRETRRVLTQVVNFGLQTSLSMRLSALSAWHQHGGVMIMGYQSFRDLMKAMEGRLSKNAAPRSESSRTHEPVSSVSSPQALLRRYLLDEGPCLIVADEGHVIKNPDSLLAKYVNMLSSNARVCLTGYPLQNNLVEYWTMVEFCFPKFLGDLADFRNSYVNPIANGLYLDSSPEDKRTSTLRMKALHRILESVVDRRDMSILHQQLPRKAEYVIHCPLTPAQMRLYGAYLAYCVGIVPESDMSSVVQAARGGNLIEHCAMLTAICNHPAVCHSLAFKSSSQTAATTTRAQAVRAQAMSLSIDDEVDLDQLDDLAQQLGDGNMSGQGTDWCKDIFARDPELGENLRQPAHSLKVVLMLEIIRRCVALGERVLVFSRSIPTLDYLQTAVDSSGILGATNGRSLRMDGATPVASRQALLDRFNAPNSPHHVFFISSRTGSIGVNLVAASRIIIFDVGWNPLYDEQAIARAYRYGQLRRVYVYRLMTAGTWEDNLFSNNTFKVAMTRRVVDRQTTGRRNTREDMRRYFQHPPLVSPAIAADDLARLAEEYHDDTVFTGLLTTYAANLAKVTPQATLLAEEEEYLREGDLAIIQSMAQADLERFGKVPVASSTQVAAAQATTTSSLAATSSRSRLPLPPGYPLRNAAMLPPIAGTRAATVASASATTGNTNAPRPFNIRHQKISIANGILHVLDLRLTNMPTFPPEHADANKRRDTFVRLIQLGRNKIETYINETGANMEQRRSKLLSAVLPGLCTDTFCALVNRMYYLNDLELQKLFYWQAPA